MVNSNPVRYLRPLVFAATLTLVASCGESGSEIERNEGLRLRKVMRDRVDELNQVNGSEYEYAEQVKHLISVYFQQTARPSPALIDDLVAKVEAFQKRRRAVKDKLHSMVLTQPLPIAVRQDAEQVLDERIAVDEDWRIQLKLLRQEIADAENLRDPDARARYDGVISETTTRILNLFQAYGHLRNSLTVEADDLEEQLRLPWE